MLKSLCFKCFFPKKFEIFSNFLKTIFSENIQEIKIFNFFRKKVFTQKNELCSYSAPLFIFAYPTSEKTKQKLFGPKHVLILKNAIII
jgi:hypothetical protein